MWQNWNKNFVRFRHLYLWSSNFFNSSINFLNVDLVFLLFWFLRGGLRGGLSGGLLLNLKILKIIFLISLHVSKFQLFFLNWPSHFLTPICCPFLNIHCLTEVLPFRTIIFPFWNVVWDVLTLCIALDSVYNLPLRITDQGL